MLLRVKWLSKSYVDHLNNNLFIIEVQQNIISLEEARENIVNSGLQLEGLRYIVVASPETDSQIVPCAKVGFDVNLMEHVSGAQQQSVITLRPGLTIRANKSTSEYNPHCAQLSGFLCKTSHGATLALSVAHLFPVEGVYCHTVDGEEIGRCVCKKNENDVAVIEINSDDRLRIQNDVYISFGTLFPAASLQSSRIRLRFRLRIAQPRENEPTRVMVLGKSQMYRGVIVGSKLNVPLTIDNRLQMWVNMLKIQIDGDRKVVTGDSGSLVVQDPVEYDNEGLSPARSDDRELLVYGIVTGVEREGKFSYCNTLDDAVRDIRSECREVFEGTSRLMGCVIPDPGTYPINNPEYDRLAASIGKSSGPSEVVGDVCGKHKTSAK